jgi:V8-like Glu-specific endopeptidase
MTSQARSLVAACFFATLLPASALAAPGPSANEPSGADNEHIDRIVQGELTNDFPATAALMGDGMAFCTGTLVAPRLVVTAAHCLEEGDPESIYFGSEPGSGGTVVGVQSSIGHPQYVESGGYVGDIGVVVLSESPFGVEPVPLSPRNADDLNGATITYVGYGDTQGTGGEGYKKKANGHITDLFDDVIEVQPEDGSACYGDSGGGVYHEDNGVLTVLGVVSFGYTDDCMDPGGNTRTDIYVDWIGQQGGGELPDPGDGNASGDDDDNGDDDGNTYDDDDSVAGDDDDDDATYDPRRDGAGCSIGGSSSAAGPLSLVLLLALGASMPRRRRPNPVPGAPVGLTTGAQR